MLTGKEYSGRILLIAATVIISVCTPYDVIRSNPPAPQDVDTANADVSTADSISSASDIDFAEAFDTSSLQAIDSVPHTPVMPAVEKHPSGSMHFSGYPVHTNKVRVAIVQNNYRTAVYSVGNAALHSKKLKTPFPVRGRILLEMSTGSNKVKITSGSIKTEIALPCTLRSDNEYNFIDIGDASYRGSMIVISAGRGSFTLVNMLDVEEYLRGVVPLELGKLSSEEIEALKAQAVAARTYTYKRIIERSREPFDLVNTVADQVYGGASVEYREADAAIRDTRDLLMVYKDSIIYAYYHSTCGGNTATIDDVWDKPPQPYLCSISDADASGKPYCTQSAYFSWSETWQWKQFSGITLEFMNKMFSQEKKTGPVIDFIIDERFACGRIKKARILGNGWEKVVGGDQVRFILRRGVSGYPILRSSNFTFDKHGRSIISLTGKGYGHGVGMCQMGAIGRSLSGQNFVTILKTYYTGVSIVMAQCASTEKK